MAGSPDILAPLKLHYLRWVLFPIKGETYFMYQGIFDTDFDKYTEDAVALFGAAGVRTVFENLEGFPMDWQTNPEAFIKFVREHQWPDALQPLREFCRKPRMDAQKESFAVRMQMPERLPSILERLRRRIGGAS